MKISALNIFLDQFGNYLFSNSGVTGIPNEKESKELDNLVEKVKKQITTFNKKHEKSNTK